MHTSPAVHRFMSVVYRTLAAAYAPGKVHVAIAVFPLPLPPSSDRLSRSKVLLLDSTNSLSCPLLPSHMMQLIQGFLHMSEPMRRSGDCVHIRRANRSDVTLREPKQINLAIVYLFSLIQAYWISKLDTNYQQLKDRWYSCKQCL